MSRKTKYKANPTGMLLFAKKSGLTSFSSLWSIKHALDTDKVGHTGTLDSFADGLLVVLSGNLTHLVPHITGFSKTYIALVCFGKETDTLDPTGEVVKTGNPVTRKQVEDVCKVFSGALLQTPPAYSAVHVDGKRASDVARSGKTVEIEPRQIFIYSNKLLDFAEKDGLSYALLEIKCSKGTYIRALARDMAYSLSTCAYLSALRRTQVGPFKLEDAALADELDELTIESGLKKEQLIKENHAEERKDTEETFDRIRSRFLTFTPDVADECGFVVDELNTDSEIAYKNGRPLNGRMFTQLSVPDENNECRFTDEIAVYYKDGGFAGMIQKKDAKLSYGFVVPHSEKKDFRIFSWEQILNGAFPVQWKKTGCALTVGSFDGMHAGHNALVDAVLSQKEYLRGIVTFRTSYKANLTDFDGEVATLHQKLEFCRDKGLDFAIVIDFSDDFSTIEGCDFVRTLISLCNMKYMAEGTDFRCGYKGAFDIKALSNLADSDGFYIKVVDDVLLDGERISSSRIRKEVIKGNFARVQKMLLRPFVYDCHGIQWNMVKEGVFEGNPVSSQILPQPGNYEVAVGFRNEMTLKTTCSVGKNLCLVLTGSESADDIKVISFIPQA